VQWAWLLNGQQHVLISCKFACLHVTCDQPRSTTLHVLLLYTSASCCCSACAGHSCGSRNDTMFDSSGSLQETLPVTYDRAGR
jgi:hypothetical protein